MGTKDDKTKEYLTDNARFADIVNFYLFKGKKVVSAADLKEKDTTECLTVYGANDAEITKQKWRDILKSCTIKEYGNTLILIIGIEDQSDIHYAMPVKNILYDAMNFASQVAEAAKEAVAEAILNDSEPIKAVKREAVLNEKRNIARKLMDDLNITEEKAFQLVGIPCAE